MYKKFNLELKDNPVNYFPDISAKDMEKYKELVKNKSKQLLESFNESLVVTESGTIDGSKTIQTWFPDYEADIFISHSHKDIELAIKLACWLEKNFELKVFIDSLLWKNIAELQKEIDKKYTYNSVTQTYDYDLRNITTSHVHTMLSTALNDMIDSTECILFLNTPSSIELSSKGNSTFSPWIYSEIKAANLLRVNIPKRFAKQEFEKRESLNRREFVNGAPQITYHTDLSKFHKISYNSLVFWNLRRTTIEVKGLDSLNILYDFEGKE